MPSGTTRRPSNSARTGGRRRAAQRRPAAQRVDRLQLPRRRQSPPQGHRSCPGLLPPGPPAHRETGRDLPTQRTGFKHTLGISHEKLGTAQMRAGRAQLARDHYAKALDLIRPLAKDDPDNLASWRTSCSCWPGPVPTRRPPRWPSTCSASPRSTPTTSTTPAAATPYTAGSGRGRQTRRPSWTAQEKDLRKHYTEAAMKALDDAVTQGFCNLTLLLHPTPTSTRSAASRLSHLWRRSSRRSN